MVDIGNFSSTSFENFDINLVQKEVDGGSVSVDQIVEAIGKTPNASSIVISGLKQDTFSDMESSLKQSLFGKTN